MSRYPMCALAGAALLAAIALPALAQVPDSSITPAPADTVATQAPGGTAAPAAPAEISMSLSKTLLRGGTMGELLAVYVPRQESEIARMRDGARGNLREAETEIGEAQRLATEADGRVRIMKEEIETTRARRDVAKKSKDAAALAELEATLKRQSSERAYLERLRDALRADAASMEADREASTARVKALDLELEVTRKYAQLAQSAPGDVDQYRQILRRMLDAQKQSAERWREASEKRKLLADRRLKQLQSLTKLK